MENAVFLNERLDLLVRVHHRRVMFAAELAADLGLAMAGQALAQIHRYLARHGDRT